MSLSQKQSGYCEGALGALTSTALTMSGIPVSPVAIARDATTADRVSVVMKSTTLIALSAVASSWFRPDVPSVRGHGSVRPAAGRCCGWSHGLTAVAAGGV